MRKTLITSRVTLATVSKADAENTSAGVRIQGTMKSTRIKTFTHHPSKEKRTLAHWLARRVISKRRLPSISLISKRTTLKRTRRRSLSTFSWTK